MRGLRRGWGNEFFRYVKIFGGGMEREGDFLFLKRFEVK
jgi:hypothetical protein